MRATTIFLKLTFLFICLGMLTGAGLFKSKAKTGGADTDVSNLTQCDKPIGTAALVETDRPEEGRPFLEKALQLSRDSGVGHCFMGECYRELGRPDEAIRAYEAAVKRNPNDAGQF